MAKSKIHRICLAIFNCDTESTEDGYITAFMANRFISRLTLAIQPPDNPSKSWIRAYADLTFILESLPRTFRATQQDEIRKFFEALQIIGDNCQQIITKLFKKCKPEDVDCYFILHFANVAWDFDVLQGIGIDPSRDYDSTGDLSTLIEFRNGHLHWRDFLKVSGFRSIKMAGMICTSAKKQEGESVYRIKKKDIPKRYEDYSMEQITYMENDVAVMDESLNILLGRFENRLIHTMNDLPMTSTGFGRFRFQHNPEIIEYDGESHNPSISITYGRWRYVRPYLPYAIRGFKGGYCGPNPHIQFQILRNEICFDARSMYPDKMLFYKMMQFTKYTRMFQTAKNYSELQSPKTTDEEQIRLRMDNAVEFLYKAFDDSGQLVTRPDNTDGSGLMPWIGTVTLNIQGLRTKDGINMMPFLSSHKLENTEFDHPINLVTCNGKILRGDNIKIILTSLDLICCFLCYEGVEVVSISPLYVLGWRYMLPVQKRDVYEAYKRKMHISEIVKKCKPETIEETRDYWENECGFPFQTILEMMEDPDEFAAFLKNYKQMIKADVNGKYGMTVEKPIHPEIKVERDDNDLPLFDSETFEEMANRLFEDPMKATKDFVKTQDYAAGSSITMWARWQLITMMFAFFCKGIEVHYCDTDSLFVTDTPLAHEIVKEYNRRKKLMYYDSFISDSEKITVDDCDDIGLFEVDKLCVTWKTLGAKNYGFLDEKGKVHLTVAGLSAKNVEKAIKAEIDKRPELQPETVFDAYFRPNTVVDPGVARKLIKYRKDIGYDENGDWRGSILVPVGFYLINTNSKFHLNNMRQAALLQGLPGSTYQERYQDNYYLDEKGFHFNKEIPDGILLDSFVALENNDFIRSGRV